MARKTEFRFIDFYGLEAPALFPLRASVLTDGSNDRTAFNGACYAMCKQEKTIAQP